MCIQRCVALGRRSTLRHSSHHNRSRHGTAQRHAWSPDRSWLAGESWSSRYILESDPVQHIVKSYPNSHLLRLPYLAPTPRVRRTPPRPRLSVPLVRPICGGLLPLDGLPLTAAAVAPPVRFMAAATDFYRCIAASIRSRRSCSA